MVNYFYCILSRALRPDALLLFLIIMKAAVRAAATSRMFLVFVFMIVIVYVNSVYAGC